MKMMRKLFQHVGKSWDKAPKDVPVIQIQKGTGLHTMFTIEANQLHFHSMSYNTDLPIKQSIVLEELTLEELVETINSMGYVASLTSEVIKYNLTARKSFTLMPAKNVSIIMPAQMKTFTSKMWEMLYPIARLLEEADYDMDKAIAQMFATATRGKWLDYWASFFNIKRNYGESDSLLARRIFMTLVNLKTNNIAIEELVQYAVQSDAKVQDVEPGLFEVVVSPEFMDKSTILHPIIQSVKGAGIDYFLNYAKEYTEDYRSFVQDLTGEEFHHIDKMTVSTDWTGFRESRYAHTPLSQHKPFRLNRSKLVTGEQVLDTPEKIPGRMVDTYTAQFEWNIGSERYPKLHHRLNIFKIGKSKLNSTSEGIFAPYHEIAVFSGEVFKSTSEVVPKGTDARTGIDTYLEERTFRVRKVAEPFTLNESKLNSSDHINGYEERVLDYYMSVAMEAVEQYLFIRYERPRTHRWFKLNSGKLNNSNHTLYGVVTYGDIINAITVDCAETFPNPAESVGSETFYSYTEHYKDPKTKGKNGFRIGYTKLVTGSKLSKRDIRTSEALSMILERGGQVIQTM